MMHHHAHLFSARRLGLLSLPMLAAVAVLAAAGPPAADSPKTLFRRAEALRQHAAQERPDAAGPAFAEAASAFDAAASAFDARQPKQKDDPEWAFCAHCAGPKCCCTHKPKDARDGLAPLLQDPALAHSSSRGLALFYHGTACFQLGDDMAAGRSLDQLARFGDPTVGPAAHRLLARLHERADERPEALAQYEAILKEYAERKEAGPPPDVATQAAFAAAVLLYEDGRFDKAHDLFAGLAASAPEAIAADARLYQGCCEVQLKQYPRAVETLSPLKAADPLTAAQALLWLGRAKAGAADPDDPDARREELEGALETMDRAAKGAPGADPRRRGLRPLRLRMRQYRVARTGGNPRAARPVHGGGGPVRPAAGRRPVARARGRGVAAAS